MEMKLISWNVNGIRACVKKGFLEFVQQENPDILCVQETKAHPDQVDEMLTQYPYHFWNSAEKKGYSGTAMFCKEKPLSVSYGIGHKATDEEDTEGRILTVEFKEFFLVNCYTPNAQRGLARLDFRQEWDKQFRAFLQKLDKKKSVILCGDLNVAHEEIDLKNDKSNHKNAGFTPEERAGMTAHLGAGFVDTFRELYPEKVQYSWWSYMFNARANNVGWRIDYFLVSKKFMKNVKDSLILDQVMGSDHCPVQLILRQ